MHKSFPLALAAAAILGLSILGPLSPVACQAVSSLARVQQLRTKYFDLYYPEALADQGQRLASFADEAFEDLESIFGKSSREGSPAWPFGGKRIPVLLSDVEFSLNGYFTPYPSNRVVIYPRSAGYPGQLASFEDELRTVFIHELTHAISLNMRKPIWTVLAGLTGDVVAPAAWIMPKALVEGTAVWIESAAGGGRLSDPAALEPVFLDLSQGRRRGLWDVSGLGDQPGSGSLPYLYGGLFSRYLETRFGGDSVAELWRLAAKGNVFAGFDGTATTRGILEKVAGQEPGALWNAFLDWLEGQAEKPSSVRDPALGTGPGRFGAFCADENRLFYLDQESRAVFSLDLSDDASKPVRLFSADGYLEEMRLSDDGSALELAWVRRDAKGVAVPAAYRWDIGRRDLELLGDRPIEEAGAAMINLRPGAPLPFLYARQRDPATGYDYGLVRMGARSYPARLSPEGSMELLDSPLQFIRSLSLSDEGGLRVVMSAAQAGGLSRIAILDETQAGGGKAWALHAQKLAPEGGALSPVPAGRARVIYKAGLAEGRQELRAAEIDAGRLVTDYEAFQASWKPLETMRRELAAEESSLPEASALGESLSKGRATIEEFSPALFPRLLSASVAPYADTESGGLGFRGLDLTERLAWAAAAGWDFEAALPEASFRLGLSIDEQYIALAFADSAESVSSGATRILSAGLGHSWNRSLLPVNRRFWTNETLQFAGLHTDYSIADYFLPEFSFASIGGGIDMGYTTMSQRPFAPFDRQGLSLSGGVDGELLPGTASALSFSGALSLALARPASILSLYGALAAGDGLYFHPSGRFYSVAGNYYPSAITAPYPSYRAYEDYDSGSPWYCFGELDTRLATIELWKRLGPVPMPFLPSWSLRRISLRTGLRAALLDRGGKPVLPSSAFARMEIDAALLAGLAAEGHIGLNLEASWAFAPELAGGRRISLDFGFGVNY